MEKVKKYQKIILQVLEEYASIKSPFMPEVENLIIADTKNHHYQLVRMGWYKDRHVHYTVFHFDILDNKVWIQENRTDVKIDEELIEAGIAAKDICSGMEHPAMRRLVEGARA
ncbi:XisI protein [Haliscomenobacter hydrossis]|uniref:XisI protein n=1 Tax=Haliscomenobacter hydrossis (strain ATCC 27775 / DSM 1100 / LMG 10767 / O) TaxID=760192 RepID=F4L5L5_HALH1|nr:XisI protein [Haliscomenobacter hydrossis]AEE51850.1 XisI protein [Haliscomenobacter hydrossis DSM 1100]